MWSYLAGATLKCRGERGSPLVAGARACLLPSERSRGSVLLSRLPRERLDAQRLEQCEGEDVLAPLAARAVGFVHLLGRLLRGAVEGVTPLSPWRSDCLPKGKRALCFALTPSLLLLCRNRGCRFASGWPAEFGSWTQRGGVPGPSQSPGCVTGQVKSVSCAHLVWVVLGGTEDRSEQQRRGRAVLPAP